MKLVSFFCVFVALSTTAHTQSLKKYPIGNSGCSVYMYSDPGNFEVTYSEDSSVVYTGESKPDSVFYSVICIKLKEAVSAGEEAESLLISYLDYLKTAFQIKDAAGYGKGHKMEKKPEARGVIDYWLDSDGNEWELKAWTDGKFIGVLFVYGSGKLHFSNKHEAFLNSFRFPGM